MNFEMKLKVNRRSGVIKKKCEWNKTDRQVCFVRNFIEFMVLEEKFHKVNFRLALGLLK